jgi:hypothetical protein
MSAPAFGNGHMGGGIATTSQQQQQQRSPENLVVVKMGVDELRALITDVVQKAVEGLRAAENEKTRTAAVVDLGVGVGADGVVVYGSGRGVEFRDDDGIGDEIVVAGSFTAADDVGTVENQNHEFSPMKEE